MESHPVNLALRFSLEVAALGSLAYWGWTANEGVVRVVLAVGLPLVAATLWATFRVPNDPGEAPVPVPGPVRLILEFGLFGASVALLAVAGRIIIAGILGTLMVLHYLVSYKRVIRLLKGGET